MNNDKCLCEGCYWKLILLGIDDAKVREAARGLGAKPVPVVPFHPPLVRKGTQDKFNIYKR